MELQLFQHPQFGAVNVTKGEDGKPLFKANDIAAALGYTQPKVAISKLCKGVTVLDTPTENQYGAVVMQPIRYLKEADVYRLVMRSKLPDAERFQDWVVEEVLPCIRQNGAYMSDEVQAQAIQDPDFIIKLATALKEQKEQLRLAQERERVQQAQLAENTKTIAKLTEKASYVDTVLASTDLLCTTQIAQDYGMSAVRFNGLLSELKIQYKMNGQWVLYSRYKDLEYVQSVTTVLDNGKTILRTNWTQKGRLFLYNKLKKNGVLPVMEREHVTQTSRRSRANLQDNII